MKPPAVPERRTQEFKSLTPPPVPEPDDVDMLDDEIPDYEYVPISWQDEDKARGFVAAAQMLYDQNKIKPAAEYLRRALDTNPNLQRDDKFIDAVARITERPREVALKLLLNPPADKTTTQESKSGWLSGLFGRSKKKD